MGEAVTVTILFTDLVDSTALAARIGDAAMDLHRRDHFAALRAALAATRGTEVKTVGDALMASYGGAADAVSGAVAMQQAVARENRRSDRERLAMRAGVSVGDASYEDGDWFGTPVVEAARLCAAAVGGQILVADVVRVLAGNRGGHSYRALGALDLKGLSESLPACEVAWSESADVALALPSPLATPMSAGLVGRDAELARLHAAWGQSRVGSRSLVLLGGDPGIGKTRLVAELARGLHEQGAIVLFGRCDEEIAAPFRPFVDALRPLAAYDPVLTAEAGPFLSRLLPQVDVPVELPPADPDSERVWMFEAVDRLLTGAARAAPVLLAIDDLHWADRPTLQLLRYLVRSTEAAALMIVATYRETDLVRTHPLAELLADLRRDRSSLRIPVGGLDLAATTAMIAGRSRAEPDEALARAVFAETEGNPFFVEEVLAHLAESEATIEENGRLVSRLPIDEVGIPEGVREVIGRRVSRLGSETNALLTTGAAIGREWDLEVARRACSLEREVALDALDEALRTGLVRETVDVPFRFEFSHALVRSTLYEELSVTQRVRLHGRVGHALEAVYANSLDDHLPELARHFGDAAIGGEAARAADYAARSGVRAAAALAFEDAVAFYDRSLQALELLDRPDDRRRFDVLLGMSKANQQLNRGDDERAAALAAANIARTNGWGDDLARAAMQYGNTLGYDTTRNATADPVVPDLIEAAWAMLPADARARRAELLSFRASRAALSPQDSPDATRTDELSAEAVALARESGDPAAIANALLGRYHAISNAAPAEELLAIADEIVERFRAAGRDFDALAGEDRRFGPLLSLGRVSDCADLIARFGAPQLAFSSWGRVVFHTRSALLALMEGRFDDASKATEILARHPGMSVRITSFDLALAIRWARGDTDGALRQLEAGLRASGSQFPALHAQHAAYLAAVGREDEARTESRALHTDPAQLAKRAWRDLAEVAARLNDSELAADVLTKLAAQDGTLLMGWSTTTCEGAAAIAIANCETAIGRYADAERHYQAGIALETEVDGRVWLPNSKVFYARMLRARAQGNDLERAAVLLNKARVDAEGLGMRRVAAEADSLATG
jgi:class 3 adenylate cyclase/tetratricopeptide (TPR) repeat protein